MPALRSPALPAQTAGAADVTTLLGTVEPTDGSGLGVTRVEISPPAGYVTVTGVATNNVTFTVRQLRAGAFVTNVAVLTLGAGTNLVAETPVNVPVTGTPTLQQDDVLDVLMHQNGTGLSVGAGLFVDLVIG